MRTHSHLFGGDHDLRRLLALVTATTSLAPHSYYHVGDVIWGLYQNTIFDPFKNICLWENGAGLRGFAWFYPPRRAEWQLHPRAGDDMALQEEMLAWADGRWSDHVDVGPLKATAFAGDVARIGLLERHGFARDQFSLFHMRRDLEAPISEPVLPAGATLRQVAGEEEFGRRVELHRAVWSPSRVTLDSYRRLRAAPVYRPELDLVAVMPDGAFASYCICWLDTTNRCGEFEPVGTHPSYQMRGLGRAVVLEGLRRLKALGGTSAIVLVEAGNEAATKLYESVGFRVYNRTDDYSRTIAGSRSG